MAIGIGLELSSSVVRGVVLERSGSQLKCLAARELPCDASSADALTQALIQMRRTLRIARPVILAVPSSAAILATVTPLMPNPHRAVLAVQFELQQQLPFELAEAAWHYQWLSSGAGPAVAGNGSGRGHEMLVLRRTADGRPEKPLIVRRLADEQVATGREAMVAAMKRSLLEQRLECCRRAGIAVGAVSVSSVALLNAWHAQHGAAASSTAAVLHVLDERAAEWILVTSAGLQVTPVASASPAGLWPELHASWNAFQAQHQELPRTVWMVGDSAPFAQLRDAFINELGVDVEQFDIATGPLILDHPERLVVALGLALQGLRLVRIPLNLLASAQGEAKFRNLQRLGATASTCLAVAAIGIGLSGAMELRQRRALILQALERREQLYQTVRPEVRTLLQRQEQIERRSSQLERLAGERTLLTQWLSQVTESLPDDVWLTKLDGAKNGILEGLLEGRARSFQDVTQFFDRLKSTGGMTTVKPLSTSVMTDEETKKDLIAFSVQIQRPVHPEASPPAAAPDAKPQPKRSAP